MVNTFLKNALNLGIFAHAPIPHWEIQAEFFENLFPLTAERGSKTTICFIKIQSEYSKMTWNVILFIFL